MNNSKRFLILTCTSEQGQKVHYPLQLKIVDEPSADQLRRTINRMQN